MSNVPEIPALPTESLPASAARRSSSAWAWAAVAIVFLLLVGIPVGYVTVSWSNAAVTAPTRFGNALTQAAVDAVRPQVTIREVVLNSIQDLQKKSKLVVFEAVVNADVTRDETSTSWGIYWGTNVARVIVHDARVQYYIDLSQMSTGDFDYSEGSKILVLRVPKPKIDTHMVSIDPAKIETLDLRGGWLRWDKQDTRDRALAGLRPKVIEQAHAPFVQQLAENAGTEALTNLLAPLANTLSKDGVSLRIEYHPTN